MTRSSTYKTPSRSPQARGPCAMDDSEILINGINAATGEYLIPPLSPEDVSRIAQGEPIDRNLLADQKAKLWRETEAHLAPVEGIDANELGEAGWGVIFAHN